MWRSSRVYFRTTLAFALYPQAFVIDSLLYADDTSIAFQHKNVTEIEKQLLRDFSSLCDWFVDNKLSIHFSQDKTNSILFGTKQKLRYAKPLNILICKSKLSWVHFGSKSLFLHRQNRFVTPTLHRVLCNAFIQPLFVYACTAWFSNL